MGRPRKNFEKITSPGAVQQLKDAISVLDRSNATEFFFTIRRRHPNQSLWAYWKRNLPVDAVDDIREFCYKEGGQQNEYRIRVHDLNNNKAKLPDGAELEDRVIPALVSSAPEAEGAEEVPKDPILADRYHDLKSRRAQLQLDRQEAQLAKEQIRLQKMIDGEDEDDDDDGVPVGPQYPFHPVHNPYGNPYGGMGGRFGHGLPPWMQPQQRDGTKEMMGMAVAMAQAMRPVEKSFDAVQMISAVAPIIMPLLGKGLEPKDMLNFMGPMVSEMTKMSGDANKLFMEKWADSDLMMREKMLDIMTLGGADEDSIDKWKKALGLATDTIGNVVKTVFGRPTVLKQGRVEVPVIAKPRAPGLPAPSSSAEAPAETPKANPEEESEKAKPEVSEQQSAADSIIQQRIHAILTAQEQEMLIGSDPVWLANKLDDLWVALPETLRKELEAKGIGEVYKRLRDFCPDLVDRILKSVEEEAAGDRKKWCLKHWEEVLRPSDEDDDDDDEEEVVEPDIPSPDSDPVPEPEKVNES